MKLHGKVAMGTGAIPWRWHSVRCWARVLEVRGSASSWTRSPLAAAGRIIGGNRNCRQVAR